jgi:hypothetical protein
LRLALARVARALDSAGLAQVYWLSLQAGSPELLDTAEMERVSERMRGYGRQQ